MIIQCPECYSDNVINLDADSNDFMCNDCGADFQADNDFDLDEEEE
jgi:transcription initiation factor TFIIIB Brf1 subunit/transcription initiation factor TFIIB